MQKIIQTIESAISNGDLYSPVYVVLALTDACANKQYPEYGNGKAYCKWIEKFHTPKSKQKHSGLFIPESTMYKFRCSLLHSSSNDLEKNNKNLVSRIIVTNTDSHFNFSDTNGVKEIQVNVKLFVEEILDSIKIWQNDAEKNGINTECSFEVLNGCWSSQEVNGAMAFKDCK
ncbi:MAG: hypothetical protein R3Y09_11690 [Clostridia bacterium]